MKGLLFAAALTAATSVYAQDRPSTHPDVNERVQFYGYLSGVICKQNGISVPECLDITRGKLDEIMAKSIEECEEKTDACIQEKLKENLIEPTKKLAWQIKLEKPWIDI